LNLVVGVIPHLYADDDDDSDLNELRSEFAALNGVLQALDLPKHHEPEITDREEGWDCRIADRAALYSLRRIAAHLALENGLPGPTTGDPQDDPVLERYAEQCHLYVRSAGQDGAAPHPASPLLPYAALIQGAGFEHLIWHSEVKGYYLPIRFPHVILLPESLRGEEYDLGPWVGSAPMLLQECERLVEALRYPRSLSIEALREYTPDPTATDWRRYASEAFMCQALIAACEESIRSGCAITFC
jgi:hypothetical protein